MASEWFYEYSGKEHGPIPPETLLHLARHGAITRASLVRRQGMSQCVAADKVKGLFVDSSAGKSAADGSDATPQEHVFEHLSKALEYCIADKDGDLMKQTPLIGCIWPWSTKILLHYELLGIERLPTPDTDMSLPLGQRTKPVKDLFRAVIKATLCDRPQHAASVEEVRRMQLRKEQRDCALICKQFQDSSWIFMDEALDR